MSRFGRSSTSRSCATTLPLSPFFFDVLHLDGEDLLDRPARERVAALDARRRRALVVPRVETDDRRGRGGVPRRRARPRVTRA